MFLNYAGAEIFKLPDALHCSFSMHAGATKNYSGATFGHPW